MRLLWLYVCVCGVCVGHLELMMFFFFVEYLGYSIHFQVRYLYWTWTWGGMCRCCLGCDLFIDHYTLFTHFCKRFRFGIDAHTITQRACVSFVFCLVCHFYYPHFHRHSNKFWFEISKIATLWVCIHLNISAGSNLNKTLLNYWIESVLKFIQKILIL